MEKIKIPNTVTSIGKRAFRGCTNLTSIEIPEGVKTIGYAAFSSCNKLTTITLPASLTSFNGTALAGLFGN